MRRMIGLMSGTSLDGLDIVVCDVQGHGNTTKIDILYFRTFEYQDRIRLQIQEIFARENVDSKKLTFLHRDIAELHADYIQEALKEAHIPVQSVDIIASHGQTVFHVPANHDSHHKAATFQIGDGDHLAYRAGICTVSDFRQKHVAAGGEGAPLAIYADRILFAHPTQNRVLLNLGGIANFTFLPGTQNKIEAFSYDTGPANTLIDQYCKKYLHMNYDAGGRLAASGEVIPQLFQRLEQHSFFRKSTPKSTGQETFNLGWVETCMREENIEFQEVNHNHVLKTLAELTVNTVSRELIKTKKERGKFEILVSGGGWQNSYICRGIEQKIQQKMLSTDSIGVDPDAKEAIMMVVLANETICGLPLNPELTRLKDFPEVSFGKLSFPD